MRRTVTFAIGPQPLMPPMRSAASVQVGAEHALVDVSDAYPLTLVRWRLNRNGYAISTLPNRKRVMMHRVISGAPPGVIVDHINGNRLDNRRENLRQCGHQENSRNKAKSGGTSRFKGVSFDKRTARWRAVGYLSGKQVSLGYFASERTAAAAYDRFASKHFGAFARLNSVRR